MSKVAITGGCGFIGSVVVKLVRARGDEQLVIDRSKGHSVENPMISEWLANIDSVIHLAGVLGTAELFDAPMAAVDVNVKGTLSVLEACKKNGARYVGIAMPECWPNVYQATKYCAKQLATAWRINFGVPVSHVRAYNAFGVGQKYGPGHPQKIIPTFATKAYMGEPLPIWGDGTQLVDLVHVDDIARMLVDATKYGGDQVFDAGTGNAMSVLSVARMVIEITGSKSKVEHLPMRLGEVPTYATFARGEGWDLLGWRPRFDFAAFEKVVKSYSR